MNNIIKRKWNQNSMVIIEDLQGMAFQAESGGHTFQISGIDGEGNAVALSGTPAGVMLRADGQDVTLTCSASEGVISATLPANAYSVPGRFGLTIFLTSDGQKTAIYAAVGTVGKTSSGTVAPPAGSDVVTLVNQINTAIAAIPANYNACFAPAYSTSGLYSVGQYVTYNGNLYRCNTAITTAETWTAAHWTQTNLGADVYDLKSAFAEQIGEITNNLYSVGNIVSNEYYKADGSTGSSASWARVKIDIGGYEKITYSGMRATGGDAVQSCWFNAENNCIGHFKQATGTNVIDIPPNAKYVGFSLENASSVLNGFSVIASKTGELTNRITGAESDITKIEETIDQNIGEFTLNLYNSSDVVPNEYYKADGSTGSSSSWARVKIDIGGYERVIYSGMRATGGDAVQSCWFNEENGCIGHFKQATGTNIIEIPSEAKYVGFSLENASTVLSRFFVVALNDGAITEIMLSNDENLKNDIITTKETINERIDETDKVVGIDSSNEVYDYQIKGIGKQDVIWSWWTRPACVRFKGVRDRIYYGFTSQNGFTGIGMYDCNSGLAEKTLLMKNNVDDHNALCVMVMPNRKIMVAYPGGHNSNYGMFVRISKYAEDISEWEEPINLPGDSVSYAQLIFANNKYWLFYRSTIYKWNYRVSSNGTTWSEERSLVSCSEQYYALFAPTSDSSKIRFCCTANPTYTDVNVRMGFIDTGTEAVYNADCETVVRESDADLTTPIANTTFSVIISAPQTGTLRLFDVLRDDATSAVHILYTLFSDNTDSKYYLYNNGETVELCNGGTALWNPKYQLGASFIDNSAIAIARNANGSDIVEIAGYDGTVSETIHTEAIGTIPIRNARPVCSPDGRAIVWQRGYYNSANYTDFDMDACLYFDEKLIV